MAPNTRSASTADEPENGASSSSAAAPDNVSISRAEFEAMQAQITQLAASRQLAPTTATETPDTVVPLETSAAAQPSPSAPGPAPVPLTAYRGKGPKPDIYYGGSRGKFNIFVRQCESNFVLEGNNHDIGRVAYGAAYLGGTPANVWDSHKKYHANPNAITWVEFKLTVYSELGDVANIQRNLTEEWHRARQSHDETVQAYAARLDQLTEDIGRRPSDSDRAETVQPTRIQPARPRKKGRGSWRIEDF